jgi:hypothetical protein
VLLVVVFVVVVLISPPPPRSPRLVRQPWSPAGSSPIRAPRCVGRLSFPPAIAARASTEEPGMQADRQTGRQAVNVEDIYRRSSRPTFGIIDNVTCDDDDTQHYLIRLLVLSFWIVPVHTSTLRQARPTTLSLRRRARRRHREHGAKWLRPAVLSRNDIAEACYWSWGGGGGGGPSSCTHTHTHTHTTRVL